MRTLPAPRNPRAAVIATLALCMVFPSSAFAQDSGGLGLDLSNGGSTTPPPATTPPADNPPADTAPADSAPSTAPVTAPESKDDLSLPGEKDASAKKDEPDMGEKDVTLEDRVKSVQKKSYDKKHHFEIAPHVGLTLNDAYYEKYNIGGSLVFHFSDALALGARFDDFIVQTTENVSAAKRALQSRLPVSKPRYAAAADFYWTPIYGKASLFNSIIHFDLFAVVGAGMVVSQTSSNESDTSPLLNQGPHPAFNIGVGQRFGLNSVVALEWTLLETLYTDTPGGTGSSQVQRVMSLSAGFSFFLPPIRSE